MTDNHDCCEPGHEHHHKALDVPSLWGKILEYKPLIVVVVLAAVMALISLHPTTAFMGYFLVLLSMFKFFDLKGFADGFQMYDVIAKRSRVYAYLYPFIEFGLGVLFLASTWPLLTNSITVVVMSVSAIGVVKNVLSGSKFKCVCLGTALNVPLTTVSIVENGGMGIMAILNILALVGQ